VLVRQLCNRDVTGVLGSQLRGQADVSGDRRGREPAKVLRIHPAEEILKDVDRHVLTQWCDGLSQGFAIGSERHGGEYTRTGFIVWR
jgi:hypothetical protein